MLAILNVFLGAIVLTIAINICGKIKNWKLELFAIFLIVAFSAIAIATIEFIINQQLS